MGAQYALDRMGRGELSTAYLLWKLASIPEGAIVFIEEPESHLAVFSQDQLVDAIVAAAVDRDLCIVISTHSPGFFKRLPPNHVSLVSSLPMPSVRSGLSFAELSGHLGVRLGKGAVLLVEDVVALEMLKAIVAAIDRPSLDSIDIRVVESGESGVARCVKDIRVDSSAAVAIAGVLDGDRRPKKAKEDGLVAYLPGSDAPEVVLKGILERWRVGEFPEWQPQVSGGRDSFLLLLERLDGLDLHDWAHQLGAELGGLKIAMQLTIDLLLRDDVLRSQSEQLVAWIRRTARVAS